MGWVLLATCIPILIVILKMTWSKNGRDFAKTEIRRNRSIADFSKFHAKSLQDRLRLRAGPNERLVIAFGIDNSFTTTDEKVHRNFRNTARSAIDSVDQAKWFALSDHATRLLESYVQGDTSEDVLLAPMIRILSLDVVIEVLFPQARGKFNVKDAMIVTTLINELWIMSKGPSPEDDPGFGLKKTQLKQAVQTLLPEDVEPLSIIMPAYETLWRVVLSTFVHVAYLSTDRETRGAVEELKERVPEHIGSRDSDNYMVLAFAREALRLYPPTKRIYRSEPGGDAMAADVEALHHNTEIWGSDAREFRPYRFKKHVRGSGLTAEQREAYMPFGIGKHVCPAANGFGERMIALLVVALVNKFGTKCAGLRITFDDEVLDAGGEGMLPTGRMDMEKWAVEVV